ncbi:GntR family transcriptional regulator [Phormidium tenue]|uniref:Transcriptional regulator n=1 Tax=Phormidium tenue NIES-30 TaxID=549789 RepID=A0A1U7JAE9_9CYAN|nr:GntR family transcriptional regulator [Phormidium tenue]MBD2230496.1 GntR family transcriptional regulator [Phormidium tenue FACHB-1052]OKH50723.1 transcriptional regulator [Phormidium tenue NIES-30]
MATPLHVSISEKLRHQIEAGEYQSGDRLPSEHQLMETFSVSRITARQAVANLVSQGLAIAYRGKGVFVTPQKKVTYSLSTPLVFLEQDMARQGIAFSFENLVFETVPAPADVATELGIVKKTGVYLQKKLLRMDGAAGAVDVSYLSTELGEPFVPLFKRQMTFPTLAENGIPVERLDGVIECTHADYDLSSYLEVPLGHALMVYRYTAYTQNQQPVLHGSTISRADRFCYSLSTPAKTD